MGKTNTKTEITGNERTKDERQRIRTAIEDRDISSLGNGTVTYRMYALPGEEFRWADEFGTDILMSLDSRVPWGTTTDLRHASRMATLNLPLGSRRKTISVPYHHFEKVSGTTTVCTKLVTPFMKDGKERRWVKE